MTVIATLISRHYTAHATDSFLTSLQADGTCKVVEDRETKLVRVPAWRGAMAYWGLARHGGDWNTLNWLRQRASEAGTFASAEDFARNLCGELSREVKKRQFIRPVEQGLGIHFTAYERINDYWIPELFLVSNWADPSYQAVRATGFLVTRETYGTLKKIPDRPSDHASTAYRLEVHESLHNDRMIFQFNNGDPVLFKPVADAIIGTFARLLCRGHLRDAADAKTHLALARRPVEVVSRLLADLATPGSRVIGGKLHDLAIAPTGEAESTTGD